MWFNSTVPGPPYLPPWGPARAFTRGWGWAPCWRCMAVVSSCCEAWPWVAQRTQPGRARLGQPGQPASGPPCPPPPAEVKSIWPRSAGPHTCHKGRPNGSPGRQPARAPNPAPSADRTAHPVREAETVSNRAPASRGEERSGSAHTAHHAPRAGRPGRPRPPTGGPGVTAVLAIRAKLTQGSGRGTCRWTKRALLSRGSGAGTAADPARPGE